MRVAIGADHAGFQLKEHLKRVLAERGIATRDFGTDSEQSTDYPDFAGRVAAAVASGEAERGLLVCGTGVGMAMAANRRRGVRAVAANDLFTVGLARAHNDANVLALGARIVGAAHAEAILERFLDAAYEGGRHQRRVAKLDASGGSEE